MRYGEIRGRPADLEAFEEPAESPRSKLPRRINLEPEKVERGLTQLVLSLVELVRQLMEKQALRRIEGGSLTAEQVERLGVTLMRLEQQMEELKVHFEIDNLNIDLGPLGNLFDEGDRGGEVRWSRHGRG
ncbi:MAG: gas vesicle protein K [Planctomycetes bacterium]|nr:gas vesicle protein K [Planctomycetota bacterium]